MAKNYLDPVRVESLGNPITRFLSGWFGKKIEPKRYYFEDGTVFQPYPVSSMNRDWHMIIQGHSDVTGVKWAKYNKGTPALNAMETDVWVSQETKQERIRNYQGPLRNPVSTWPEPWRTEYELSHGGHGRKKREFDAGR